MSAGGRGVPLHVFRFHVDFREGEGADVPLCAGAFAECSGLEATMEPKTIREGGRNYGAIQRAGQVTFATVILRRGMTETRHLWTWFDLVNRRAAYAHRLTAFVNVYDLAGRAVLAWRLTNALPVKFKAADLNARGSEVGLEELHLAHEGLALVPPTRTSLYE
jgi:phage tail-like protein